MMITMPMYNGNVFSTRCTLIGFSIEEADDLHERGTKSEHFARVQHEMHQAYYEFASIVPAGIA